MPYRRPGAPRLLAWTGERLVPWAPDAQLIYEHFHRYLWAQPLVAGRRVLDLGSGEGFGAALLADAAQSVTGVDVDERTVEHSRLNYEAPNLEFQVASATDLAAFGDRTFDAVVAFEIVEHVADQDGMLDEVARVLAPGGLLVLSTPERRTYSDQREFENPFHERELTEQELTALVGARFSAMALFAQRAVTGSRIEALDRDAAGPHLALALERWEDEWRRAGPPEPLYLVAVATNGVLPALPAQSSLSDYDLGLLDEVEARRAGLEREVRELVAERERLIAELTERRRESDEAHARAQRAEDELREMRESTSWQALERARRVVYGILGERSPVARALRRLLARLSPGRRRA